MLTTLGLLALVYAFRRPLLGISTWMFAFSVGFVIGWRLVKRR